jgi:uroporphyrinogen-III synthase
MRDEKTFLPLAGKRILVTRAAHQAGKLSDELRALGAEPVEVPVLEIRPPLSYEPLDAALRILDQYKWLIFTSANTVDAFAARAGALGITLPTTKQSRVAAIGSATAAAAEKIGLSVSLTPKAYVAESLVHDLLQQPQEVSGHGCAASGHESGHASGHEFTRAERIEKRSGALAPEEKISGQRILLARAATARDVIPDTLRSAGAHVDVIDAYRNVLPDDAPEKLRLALQEKIHAATFTSSSSVTHLAEAAQKAGIAFPLAGIPAISIGPITSQTLRESGWPPAAEATVSNISGLIAAVVEALETSQ